MNKLIVYIVYASYSSIVNGEKLSRVITKGIFSTRDKAIKVVEELEIEYATDEIPFDDIYYLAIEVK